MYIIIKAYHDYEGIICLSHLLNLLTHKISLRIARYLERSRLIERDAETFYLTEDALDESEMFKYQGHSIQYRISVRPHQNANILA